MSKHYGTEELIYQEQDRFQEFGRTARLLFEHPDISSCQAYRQVVNVNWYLDYFDKQQNLMLVRGSRLPEGMLGLVVVRDILVDNTRRHLFLVQVATMESEIQEQFTIAHELGHILLHGQLMHAGMIIPERSWERSFAEDERRRLMELEANIYALLSIVPNSVIDMLEEVVGAPIRWDMLQVAMTRVRAKGAEAQPFPASLAQERVVLHNVLKGRNAEDDFHRYISNRSFSWTDNGAAGLRNSKPHLFNGDALDSATLERFERRLRNEGLIA